MLKFSPILLALIYGVVVYIMSAGRLHRELDQKSSPLDDTELEALSRKMARALDLDQIAVNIYEIDPVNGLAAPDGRIFLTRGFINKYKMGEISAPELASVIAHELGHVALGHTRRRWLDFSGQNAIRVTLSMVLSRFLGGFGVMIANWVASGIAARVSRGDEFEADEYAAALLTRAGIGTAGQISLFRKFEAQSGGSQPTFAWLMSHPKMADRIAAIEALEDKWHAPSPQ
ncbi:peptidase M48 [Amylibacter marinus]|uniref:Peptidase M48 n=1 Tax=Amylibacter marinus TaxID=1475483 RepID=A0ABQ5VTQ8_9RHOB|nr:M48 family metallopeptidase [Amylibacter marinus]GLQ34820.1 peptidase M48 [Amylibacter marinus]